MPYACPEEREIRHVDRRSEFAVLTTMMLEGKDDDP